MDRREAVRYISILLGGSLAGSNAFLTGCSPVDKKAGFSEDDLALLDEIADTILPETRTPGAKAARVGEFMTVMVNDCYDEKEQKAFMDGIEKIKVLSRMQLGTSFVKATPQQRHQLLVQLDKEQKAFMEKKKPDETPHYFRMMKELTLLGYFTSEPGATKAKRYVPVPGKFVGCVDYKKGEGAFS